MKTFMTYGTPMSMKMQSDASSPTTPTYTRDG